MKEAKAVEIPDFKRRDIILDVACRDCVFYTHLATFDKPCKELAVAAAAVPCNRFVADPRQIDSGNELARIMRIMKKAKRKSVLAAVLISQAKVARKGFSVGQTVVFRVLSADYINNYATGFVLGVNGNRVVLGGKADFTAFIDRSTILTLEQWEAKRDALIGANRVNDPNGLEKIYTPKGPKLKALIPALVSTTRKRNDKGRVKRSKLKKQGTYTLSDGR